jgi:antitoxin (DNA-binding transcriptional repressor) of toxin-antitoxin stability system
MTMVTLHQAKTNLSRLLREATQGIEVIIARGPKPVALRQGTISIVPL